MYLSIEGYDCIFVNVSLLDCKILGKYVWILFIFFCSIIFFWRFCDLIKSILIVYIKIKLYIKIYWYLNIGDEKEENYL